MKAAGIVCECNPLHEGHQYLISEAKKNGADAVVCVMSGYFVQRGEPAVADPYLRAEALLAGGADAVVELPFPYSSASAEFFSAAGVSVLSRLGADELWFGSECGDLSHLQRLASIASSKEFEHRYAAAVGQSEGTATLYFDLLREFCGGGISCDPNDILGLSYLRAIEEQGATLIPRTVRRVGSGYGDAEVTEGKFPSATALRALLSNGGVDAAREYLLPATAELLSAAFVRGAAPAEWKWAERLILGRLRTMTAEEIESAAELGGGLGARLLQGARVATGVEELFSIAATKKYPTSRLRRGMLFALTGIGREVLSQPPAYTRLLAANDVGCRFLATRRREDAIPVVTRRADLPDTREAQRQAEWERRAFGIWTLCLPKPMREDGLWKHPPRIRSDFEKMGNRH